MTDTRLTVSSGGRRRRAANDVGEHYRRRRRFFIFYFNAVPASKNKNAETEKEREWVSDNDAMVRRRARGRRHTVLHRREMVENKNQMRDWR